MILRPIGALVTVTLAAMIVSSTAAVSNVTAPAGYVYTRLASGVTYGQPRELGAIRQRLTLLCTGGRKGPGVGPGQAFELIQIDDYAIAEGSCGNAELHLVLKKAHGLWQGPQTQRCGLGGGVNPDYGSGGVYNVLVNCAFPASVACRMTAIRSTLTGMAAYDKSLGGVPPKACSKSGFVSPRSNSS